MKNKKNLFHLSFILIFIVFSVGNSKAITNGEPDDYRHPYIGLLVLDIATNVPAYRCTGILIAPTIVLTAGHCTDGAIGARIWFEEVVEGLADYPYGGGTSIEGTPYTHPDFCIGCAMGMKTYAINDIGIVVLDEPVYMDSYAELPEAGLVDTLSNKTSLEVVGYGVQEMYRGGGPPYWQGEKVRLLALSQLIAANFNHSDILMRVTQNPGEGKGGTCYGDSGGPDLLTGTNTVLALHSYNVSYNCVGISHSTRIDTPETLEFINSFMD